MDILCGIVLIMNLIVVLVDCYVVIIEFFNYLNVMIFLCVVFMIVFVWLYFMLVLGL